MRSTHEPVLGLYLWGGVGIGKTWLMDIFYDTLPANVALRMHFHQFMYEVHEQLKQLQNKINPLEKIARDFAKQYSVLCFDEMFVSDIADAMLLSGLFKSLFHYGVCLVTTSNVDPDLLYKGGINRERFLPAIERIKKYTKVLHLSTKKDYRLMKLNHVPMYYYPLNESTHKKMMTHFKKATGNRYEEDEILMIEHRGIVTVAKGRGVVWFDFNELCNIPRNQVDYLQIATLFHTVFLSNVPKLSSSNINEVLYLINLVDVFYDANVKLVISAQCAINDLYADASADVSSGASLQFEFARTRSRLQEMQTLTYFQALHCYSFSERG